MHLSYGSHRRRPSCFADGLNSGQIPNTGHNDGCHRLYKAARLGRAHLPSLVLTAAETLAIRSDAVFRKPSTSRACAR
jgi:hypothetical protein